MTPCETSKRCAVPWPELAEHSWQGVRLCKNCDRLVFSARTPADASALGRVGQCVQLGAPELPGEFFVGVFREPGQRQTLRHATANLVVVAPSDPAEHARAVEGFRMYFGALQNFAELHRNFENNLPVSVGVMSAAESIAWIARCREWGITVKVAGAA
jgi:hypothetical protein